MWVGLRCVGCVKIGLYGVFSMVCAVGCRGVQGGV